MLLNVIAGERPYKCPKCGKAFNQQGKVTRHMRSHSGERPFCCPQCRRSFISRQALAAHYLIHTGEKPYVCEYCGKGFTGLANLKKHSIIHTGKFEIYHSFTCRMFVMIQLGILDYSPGKRPFQCHVCSKSFALKWTLDLHLRTHSAERPFLCEKCPRAFTNSKDLRRHSLIHTGTTTTTLAHSFVLL